MSARARAEVRVFIYLQRSVSSVLVGKKKEIATKIIMHRFVQLEAQLQRQERGLSRVCFARDWLSRRVE